MAARQDPLDAVVLLNLELFPTNETAVASNGGSEPFLSDNV